VLVSWLICSPVFAGDSGKHGHAAKELVDASGRVWPQGVPASQEHKGEHPEAVQMPRPIKHWKK